MSREETNKLKYTIALLQTDLALGQNRHIIICHASKGWHIFLHSTM